MDGLTVDGESDLNATVTITHANPRIKLIENDTTNANTQFSNDGGDFAISTMNDAESTFTKRFNLDHATGDVSFYDTAGTTAKFFWDASAESLGIGVTNPNTSYAITANKGFKSEADFPNFTLVETDSSDQTWQINSTATKLSFRDISRAADRIVVDTAGNVGIGTSSPATKLHVQTTGGTLEAIRVDNATVSDSTGIYLRTTSQAAISWGSGGYLAFYGNGPGNAERARIDSSGNLLVGTTSLTVASQTGTTQGIRLASGADNIQVASNSTPAIFNKLGADGGLIQFNKSGTTVGSIGTVNGDMYLGTGDTGLFFSDGANYIMPYNVSTPGLADGLLDLGRDTNRFKDLYLSGGVYLGGTGTANKLDDYEEGTWTPAISVGTHSYSQQQGKYTKIGNQVTVWARMIVTSRGSSGSELGISGLPFASSGSPYASTFGMSNTYGTAGLLPAAVTPTGSSMEGSIAYLRNQHASNNSYSINQANTSGGLTIAFTYRTS